MNPDTPARNIGFLMSCHSWIMDLDTLRPVPVGAIGELCVSEPILAKGYLNNDVLTRKVFMDDFDAAGCRVYRTGDLVRYQADGSMYYVGRKDSQIKHYGQRIEMGGIENMLAGHEAVRHCTVVRAESGHCKGRLTAVLSLQVDTVIH